jgi:hypothetical protein
VCPLQAQRAATAGLQEPTVDEQQQQQQQQQQQHAHSSQQQQPLDRDAFQPITAM